MAKRILQPKINTPPVSSQLKAQGQAIFSPALYYEEGTGWSSGKMLDIQLPPSTKTDRSPLILAEISPINSMFKWLSIPLISACPSKFFQAGW